MPHLCNSEFFHNLLGILSFRTLFLSLFPNEYFRFDLHMPTALSVPGVIHISEDMSWAWEITCKRGMMDMEERLGNSTASFLHGTPDTIMTKYWKVHHKSTPENMCASNFGGLPYYPTPLRVRAGQRKEVLVMES